MLAKVKTCSIFGRAGCSEDRSLLEGIVVALIARHAAPGETLILGSGGGGAPASFPPRRRHLGAHGSSYVASYLRGGSARSGVAALSAFVSCLGCMHVLRWRGVWLYWRYMVAWPARSLAGPDCFPLRHHLDCYHLLCRYHYFCYGGAWCGAYDTGA